MTKHDACTCTLVVSAILLWPATAQSQEQPDTANRRQAAGQSLNPDISAIGELLIDLSPRRPRVTTEGERFEVREVELGIQAVVDPFFRADFFIGLHPDEVEIEEAYLTALALPGGLQARLGRFHAPIGKVNLIHRPEQITIDYPWMVREFFGDEGLATNGIGLSGIFAPLGFFQEFLLYAVSNIGFDEHAHGANEETGPIVEADAELANQVAFIAQLRNYWDLSSATNLEVGISAATGKVRELEELGCGPDFEDPCLPGELPASAEVFESQHYYGAHVTLRWRPQLRGLYRSFIWNSEVLLNDGHQGKRWGAFSQAQYQLTRRFYIGARFDAVETFNESAAEDRTTSWFNAGSGYLTFFPSEFSRWKLAVERTFGSGDPFGGDWRIALQTSFAIGPHRPHAF